MPSAYAPPKSDKDGGGGVRDDIGGLMAELASRPQVATSKRKLTGPERAAVLMLALGQRLGTKVFALLDDDELREISVVMSSLGNTKADTVKKIFFEFAAKLPDL